MSSHKRIWQFRNAGLTLFWLISGLALRVWQFNRFPLREDEALYCYWARLVSSGRDVMLERVAVDKPPFFIYTLARWFDWFGPSDASGRSLNVLISFINLTLVWLLARRLFGPRAGRWVLAMFALSPFAISFAPTTYTDPMLTLWLLAALLAASWRLGLLAGLALGMGFATKQPALLFIPLILLALPLGRWPDAIWRRYAKLRPEDRRRPGGWLWRIAYWLAPWAMAGLGFWFVWFKVWQWDGWRILPAEIPDFWTQSWHSYGGLAWVALADWPGRLAQWWQVGRWWGGGAWGTLLTIALGGVAALAAWQSLKNNRNAANSPLCAPNAARWLLLFASFSAAYLALHFFLGFQTWDRYLLPLAPLSAMLTACGALWLWERSRAWPRIGRWAAAALVSLPLLLGAGRAADARIPVGGDHGAYSGLLTVADFLRSHTPDARGVVYQRWLGWQWDWYLWDGPPRVYWADAEMLVADLAPDPHGYTRFVVFPAWRLDEKPALDEALAAVGLHLQERLRTHDVRTGETRLLLYELEPHRR